MKNPDQPAAPVPVSLERHFTVQEIGAIWQLSEKTITKLFADEPGVMRISVPRLRSGKRPYITLRLPESVVARVYRRLTK